MGDEAGTPGDDNEVSRTFVQRIIRVRLQKQGHEAEENGAKGQNWLPIRTENVQTNGTLPINIGMIHLIISNKRSQKISRKRTREKKNQDKKVVTRPTNA
jgi:hypothetical protein